MENNNFDITKPLSYYYIRCKKNVPYISLLLFATCSLISLFTYFDNDLFDVFCLSTKPIYWWQYFVGAFEHSIYPKWFFWAHYLGNMSVIFTMGILVERVIGNTRMFLVSIVSFITYINAFQLLNKNGYDTNCGISGIVWSYAPIALFIIIKLFKNNKKTIMKDKLFYLLIFEFLFIWLFITLVSDWQGTNRYHVIATLVGILFLFIWKKTIIDQIVHMADSNKKEKSRIIIIDRFVVGICIMCIILTGSILFRFYTNHLDRLYTHEIGRSQCDTLQQIQNNNGVIELYFNIPVVNFRSVSTDTPGNGEIALGFDYSKDNKIMYVKLETKNLEKDMGVIKINGIRLRDGRIIKNIKIKF